MNLDKFNKEGNCKLQGGLFIVIGKFSMGQLNIGGNCVTSNMDVLKHTLGV
jgi:hypothetical protein